jgi:hypothetical protein
VFPDIREGMMSQMEKDITILKRELIHASMFSHGIHRVDVDGREKEKETTHDRDSEMDASEMEGTWDENLHRIRALEKEKSSSFRKMASEKRMLMKKTEDQQRTSLEIDLLPAIGQRSKGRKKKPKKPKKYT